MILLLGIFGGPFYCGWICPMGFFQDLTTLIAKKIQNQTKSSSSSKMAFNSIASCYLIFMGLIVAVVWVSTAIQMCDTRRVR